MKARVCDSWLLWKVVSDPDKPEQEAERPHLEWKQLDHVITIVIIQTEYNNAQVDDASNFLHRSIDSPIVQ